MKGPAPRLYDGSGLRIGIMHARWNAHIVDPLVEGTKKTLAECGVSEANVVVQSVPGSWELPLAVQRFYAASQVQSSSSAGGGTSAGDLLAGSTTDLTAMTSELSISKGPFDAIIAIGVLIKGETMHFEYISETVSTGLMRVSLDTGVPVVFGVLTVLNEDQALNRAGLKPGAHNHGGDWGLAAVEMGVKRKRWATGKME